MIDEFEELNSTSSIITTNKNKTATAPTYTITNIKAKNSAPRIKNIPAELKKQSIRKRTECTGFLDKTTIKADAIIINENK